MILAHTRPPKQLFQGGNHHSGILVELHSNTDVQKFSFFPGTISNWIQQQPTARASSTLESFVGRFTEFLSNVFCKVFRVVFPNSQVF